MAVYIKRATSETLPPDYVNFSAAGEILSITGVFTGLALLTVLFRIYVRAFMLRFFGPDDQFMVIAMILSILTFVCFVKETQYGLGKHTVVMVADAAGYETFLKWLYTHSIVVMVAVSTVKVSVASFLLRLAQRTPYIRFLWGMIIFLFTFTIACSCTLIFQCTPVHGAWDNSPKAKCFSTNTFRNLGLFNSCVNIITDVTFASLPIPLIWQLQINLRTKISLVCILSLGYFACAAAMVKAVAQYHMLEEADWTVHDTFMVWNCIELNVGIMAASLPALKPLFNWFLETARAITTGSGARGSGSRRVRPSAYAYNRNSLGYLKQLESSSIAMTTLPSMHAPKRDGTMGRVDPYVAQVSSGGRAHGRDDDNDEVHLHSVGSTGRESAGGSTSAGKDGWDAEGRKTSGDGILPSREEAARPRAGVIVRTTEVRVD